VKFFDIKKRFFSGSDKMDPCDDEDDSWLDKPNLEVVLPEPALKVSPFVQLSSKCLSTALSEEPCSSGSASEAPPLAASLDENTLPDDDFSMDL
jgi:hypothetical protein